MARRVDGFDPGHPEVCNVFDYYKVFRPAEVEKIEDCCRKGLNGCVQCKKTLGGYLEKLLKPIHEKRKELEVRPAVIDEILSEGNKKAGKTARNTMAEIKEVMKIA